MCKFIRVPKNNEALNAYNYGMQTPEQVIELQLKKEEFYYLYKIGLFDAINNVCDSLIDDYEEEILSDWQLKEALKVIEMYESNNNNELIQRIKRIFQAAIKFDTAIGFDF